MSMIKDRTANGAATTNPPPFFGCFLGCFGFSGKRRIQPTDKLKSASRHRRRSLSRWKFCRTNTHATVNGKTTSKTHAPAAAKSKVEIQAVHEDPTLTQKQVNKVGDSNDQIIILDGFNENFLDVKISTKPQNNRRWSSFGLKKSSKAATTTATTTAATNLNHPGSTGNNKSMAITRSQSQNLLSHFIISSPSKSLTHSISLPPTTAKKPPRIPAVDQVEQQNSNAKSDSLIGMSIILVILVILLVWGKLCAILCTSAWFFTAPRLRTVIERCDVTTTKKKRPKSKSDEIDFDSVEYKKKVVLKGLLQRNHRNVGAFL